MARVSAALLRRRDRGVQHTVVRFWWPSFGPYRSAYPSSLTVLAAFGALVVSAPPLPRPLPILRLSLSLSLVPRDPRSLRCFRSLSVLCYEYFVPVFLWGLKRQGGSMVRWCIFVTCFHCPALCLGIMDRTELLCGAFLSIVSSLSFTLRLLPRLPPFPSPASRQKTAHALVNRIDNSRRVCNM